MPPSGFSRFYFDRQIEWSHDQWREACGQRTSRSYFDM